MRKIISIVIALGLILGLSVMAVPVGAQPPPCATIIASNNCSGSTATYTITFNTPVTLEPANDLFSVTFPTGTTFGTFVAGDIMFHGSAVDLTKLVVTDTKLVFPVPGAVVIVAGAAVVIVINNVVNGPAGTNPICLDYELDCCDEVEFCCINYLIIPAVSTLGFHFDFSPTYAGLAEDFIPPFKACGQVGYGHNMSGVGWVTNFTLILRDDIPGCQPPCANATMWFVLTKCPAGEVVSFGFAGSNWTLTAANITDPVTKIALPNVLMPPPPPDVTWDSWIHFSSPGEYELCFYLECPAVVCAAGPQTWERCMPCKAYQWKDAVKIPLYRKWNLISLPLVPLVDPPVADMLKAYMWEKDVMSIWYYDQCADKWYVYPAGTPGADAELTDLEDGKSYWVRIVYNSTHPAGMAADGLWTWGTPKPVPPLSPSEYEVCEGWNMVGLTGGYALGSILDDAYLWNWFNWVGYPEYSGIYGWTPWNQTWWSLTPIGNWLPNLYVGEGYWISFLHDGMIYPP